MKKGPGGRWAVNNDQKITDDFNPPTGHIFNNVKETGVQVIG